MLPNVVLKSLNASYQPGKCKTAFDFECECKTNCIATVWLLKNCELQITLRSSIKYSTRCTVAAENKF